MGAVKFSELGLLLKLEYSTDYTRTLVDVGSHVGGFAKPFAKRGWRVIAFEPEPTNYKELCVTFKDYSNITCISKAISDKSEHDISFYVSSDHWGIHSLKPFHKTHNLSVNVDAVRLDEELDNIRVDHVTLLKIDTEGADFLALKSFDFNRFQPEVIMCEFMDQRSKEHFGYTHHDMASYMDGFGYQTFVSEWAPIKEYARKGRPVSHTFLQCAPYPLNHDSSWGNLIFVPKIRVTQFERILSNYLKELRRYRLTERMHSIFARHPYFRTLYYTLKKRF